MRIWYSGKHLNLTTKYTKYILSVSSLRWTWDWYEFVEGWLADQTFKGVVEVKGMRLDEKEKWGNGGFSS